ncbi:MAG TPA: hypothetical protein VG406_02500 [Isosphaeraceae bacterium]|jgi:hypothetical protein|nr:hypothetical protein [Isosphaeraceae bacterium]
MSTTIEAPAPATVGPRNTRPIVGRWRAWLIPLGTLAAGVVVGIALTYLTVVVPRTQELGRQHEESSFLRTFSPQAIFDRLGPIAGKVNWSTGTDKNNRGDRVRGKTFEGRCKLSSANQASLLSALPAKIIRIVQQAGGYVWSQGSSSSVGVDGRREHYQAGYEVNGTAGVIHVWATARGDEMDLIVIIHEY